MTVHHVGIATQTLEATAERFSSTLELEIAHDETIEDRAIRVAFLGEGPYLELLEPRGPGPIERFLERDGPGLHHVAIEVEDIRGALERAQGAGADPIDETPRPGAWGHRIAFLHPNSMGGVLLELVEPGGH